MEKYTFIESLQNITGFLANPIVGRKNKDLFESAVVVQDKLPQFDLSQSELDKLIDEKFSETNEPEELIEGFRMGFRMCYEMLTK